MIIKRSSRLFSSYLDLSKQMATGEPNQYDPRVLPNLFTETFTDENDQALAKSYENLMASQSKKSYDAHIDRKKKEEAMLSVSGKNEYFKMTRPQYQYLLEKCEDGDVTYVRMNNEAKTNVVFFAPDSQSKDFKPKNLYKALNLVKPDIVLAQMSPDLLLDDFEVHPEKHEDGEWKFSE